MPEDTLQFTPQSVQIRTSDVNPPSFVYCSREDQLVVYVASSLPGTFVEVMLRFLRPSGELQRLLYMCQPNANRLPQRFAWPMEEGFILSITATQRLNPRPLRGQCYVRALLRSGGDGTGDLYGHMLLQGYLSQNYSLVGPNGEMESPASGQGYLYNFTSLDPIAGAEWVMKVPVGAVWRIQSVMVKLVTDATVVNRETALQLDDGATVVGLYPAAAVVTAGKTMNLTWGAGSGGLAVLADTIHSSLPSDLRVPSGYNLSSRTFGMQVADNYQTASVLVEEWLQS